MGQLVQLAGSISRGAERLRFQEKDPEAEPLYHKAREDVESMIQVLDMVYEHWKKTDPAPITQYLVDLLGLDVAPHYLINKHKALVRGLDKARKDVRGERDDLVALHRLWREGHRPSTTFREDIANCMERVIRIAWREAFLPVMVYEVIELEAVWAKRFAKLNESYREEKNELEGGKGGKRLRAQYAEGQHQSVSTSGFAAGLRRSVWSLQKRRRDFATQLWQWVAAFERIDHRYGAHRMRRTIYGELAFPLKSYPRPVLETLFGEGIPSESWLGAVLKGELGSGSLIDYEWTYRDENDVYSTYWPMARLLAAERVEAVRGN